MPNIIDVLLRFKAETGAISAAKAQLADFRAGLAAGFNLNIGSALANQLLALPGHIKNAAREAISYADNIKDAGDRTRATSEEVQVLDALAVKNGTDFARLEAASAKLTVALANARDASSSTAANFRTLGLDAARLENMPLSRRYEAIAVSIVSAKDQTAAYAAASDILGARNLPALSAALKELAEQGYDKVAQSAIEAGQVMSDGTMERLARAEDAIKEFTKRKTILEGEAIGKGMVMWDAYWEYLRNNPKTGWLVAGISPGATVFAFSKIADMRMAQQDAAAKAKQQATPPYPIEDAASVQRLLDKEVTLGAAKQARLRVERDLADIQRALSSIQSNPLLTSEERESMLAKYYGQQADALTDKANAMQDELEITREINALRDRGFRTGGDNSPDKVAERDVTNLGSGPLTPAQAKALAEKRARDNAAAGIGTGIGEAAAQAGQSEQQIAMLSTIGQIKEDLTEMERGSMTVGEAITSNIGVAVSSVSSQITGWIMKAQTFGQALRNIGMSIMQQMLQTMIQIGVQQTINTILTKTGMIGIDALSDTQRAARVAKENEATAAVLPGKTAEATATGISSFGTALVFGTLAIALIMAAMGGFATGGYTQEGSREKPAGIVHAGEWVAPQWMVRHPVYGPMIASMEAGRAGGYMLGGFARYASGGMVTMPQYQPAFSGSAAGSIGASTTESPISIAVYDSRAPLKRFLRKREGRKIIANINSRNSTQL